MDEATRTAIERACERLSIAYARHVDLDEHEAFVELFADDAVLVLGRSFDGKAAIRRSMGRRRADLRSRHVLTNVLVDVVDEDHARGITYLTLYRHIGPESSQPGPIAHARPAAVGEYLDEFVRTPAGWRFARREISLAFRDPAAFPDAPGRG